MENYSIEEKIAYLIDEMAMYTTLKWKRLQLLSTETTIQGDGYIKSVKSQKHFGFFKAVLLKAIGDNKHKRSN